MEHIVDSTIECNHEPTIGDIHTGKVFYNVRLGLCMVAKLGDQFDEEKGDRVCVNLITGEVHRADEDERAMPVLAKVVHSPL